MNLSELSAPFEPHQISWRVGPTNKDKTSGIALAYLTARDVMDRFDKVCGLENVQVEYPFEGCCRIGIKLAVQVGIETPVSEWVWKSNGAGPSGMEGEKGRYSGAFKRAAVLWGVGRYLYDLPNTWHPIEPRGRSYVFSRETIKNLESRLAQWQSIKFGVKDDEK